MVARTDRKLWEKVSASDVSRKGRKSSYSLLFPFVYLVISLSFELFELDASCRMCESERKRIVRDLESGFKGSSFGTQFSY